MFDVDVDTPAIPMHPPDRADRWQPARSGALPLTIGFRGVDGVADNLVELGIGEPVVWVKRLPDCGCDACDDGSELLLDNLDDLVEHVVTGGFLRVDTPDGYAQTTPDGWLSHNLPDADWALHEARAGISPHRVVSGNPWW